VREHLGLIRKSEERGFEEKCWMQVAEHAISLRMTSENSYLQDHVYQTDLI
jgi:hypothetical protein